MVALIYLLVLCHREENKCCFSLALAVCQCNNTVPLHTSIQCTFSPVTDMLLHHFTQLTAHLSCHIQRHFAQTLINAYRHSIHS